MKILIVDSAENRETLGFFKRMANKEKTDDSNRVS